MSEYNMSHTGAELDEAIERVLNGDTGKYYASSFNNSEDKQTMTFDVGFKPKLFVILTVNGFANSSKSTYYITCIWHVADVTGENSGEYTGGLSVITNSSNAASNISYGANNYYTYSNGVVTINDSAHYFKANTLYRAFAMA